MNYKEQQTAASKKNRILRIENIRGIPEVIVIRDYLECT